MKINKSIIICYGELFLKGKNKIYFVEKLIKNIKTSLDKNEIFDFSLEKMSDHLKLNIKNYEEIERITEVLKKIFGISNFYLANILEKDIEKLYIFSENVSENYDLKNISSFRLKVKRNDKKFPKNSLEIQKEIGALISSKYNLKVDLSNPQKTFHIKICQKYIIFFDEKIEGAKGLPVGSSGRALVLMSGGIDSPVASHELMKRGLEIDYIHFYHQNQGQDKIKKIVEELSIYNNFSKRIYLINFLPILNEISHISNNRYRLILLKRMFMRLSCLISQRSDGDKKIDAIATGDSLGQVASQTIESLKVISDSSSNFIIFPLITLDKQEIIEKAKKIGTYDLSILKYNDCCSLFEPKYPVTKPTKEYANQLEKELENDLFNWNDILENIFQKREVVN